MCAGDSDRLRDFSGEADKDGTLLRKLFWSFGSLCGDLIEIGVRCDKESGRLRVSTSCSTFSLKVSQ